MNEEKKAFAAMSDSLIEFLLAQRKKLMIITVAAIVCSTIVAYILPVRYRATTIVFAPQDNNISKTLFNDQPYSRDYMSFGDEKDCEQMEQILKSNEVLEAMAAKFNLMKYYGIPEDSKIKYATLKDYYYDNFNFEITEYQSIKIDVYDKNPDTAAKMANAIITVADTLYRRIINQRAGAALHVAKQQFDSIMHQVNVLEDSMNFFRKQGITSYDNQIKEYTRGYAEAEIKGNTQNIKDIEDKLMPFQKYGKEYWNMAYRIGDAYRWRMQVQTAYIQAKANSERTIPAFFIAEKAVAPDKKAYPIRWLVVAGSTFAALLFSIVLLLFMSRFQKKQ